MKMCPRMLVFLHHVEGVQNQTLLWFTWRQKIEELSRAARVLCDTEYQEAAVQKLGRLAIPFAAFL